MIKKYLRLSIMALPLLLMATSCESILDSLDKDAEVRYVNSTIDGNWSGVRLDEGIAEYTGSFGPGTTTPYVKSEDSGTFGLDAKAGDTWLSVGTGVNVTEGNKYTITISQTVSGGYYSVDVDKD